jgi:Flp pilus assembly protein TadG
MATLRRLLHALMREGQGSAMLETALGLMLTAPLLFSVFEVSMFTYTQAVLGDAARVGIRYAIVHGTDSTACSGPSTGCADSSGANVISTVKNYAAESANLSGVTVAVSYPDGVSSPPSRVLITVNYKYVTILTTAGLGGIPMNATAEGRIVY